MSNFDEGLAQRRPGSIDCHSQQPITPKALDWRAMPWQREGEGDAANELQIGSVLSLSARDFPDRLSAVVYCRRDAARAAQAGDGRYSWSALEYFLMRSRQRINGLVFDGDEPLAQPALRAALLRARQLGFATAVHTLGGLPDRLRDVLPMLDWAALSVAPGTAEHPGGLSEVNADVRRSLEVLLAGGGGFECRSSVQWGRTSPVSLLRLGKELAAAGVRRYTVFVNNNAFLPAESPSLIDPEVEAGVWHELGGLFDRFCVRESFTAAA